jgi:septal ring factor EnvC (AmiA/AmiB activator)
MPFQFKDHDDELYSISDFLLDQDDWIEQTKRQLALIEVKATALGNYQYDIPSHLKKSKNEKRARRDNYTCLLMAYYGSKHYFDIIGMEEDFGPTTFTPLFF